MTADEALTLPYAGGSGWSGSDTSHAREIREDRDGTTAGRQAHTLAVADSAGRRGITVGYLRYLTGWHHGQASGVLSCLHKAGRLERLADTDAGMALYVLPECVDGRKTRAHGRAPSAEVIALRAEVTRLRALLGLEVAP